MGCVGQNKEGTLVPEFGAWDVTDPKSGEGYTDIFRKIREEKQSTYRHFPNKTPSPNNIQNQCGRPSSIFSKVMLLHILGSNIFLPLGFLFLEAIFENKMEIEKKKTERKRMFGRYHKFDNSNSNKEISYKQLMVKKITSKSYHNLCC